ncbi:MAG: hypothetical protein FD161_1377 [Limisphaerales bacterium]|nr:MAG: hypothetical protein FD161_1377 [Limisphaerales bacterium]KAG0509454.1 MAG: hypothetical protein E1N63_1296 [Limisphaerales bacterium]TXT52291.1 MAG: hypothetical protein FD140_778 [Limisphaerales bacterium]
MGLLKQVVLGGANWWAGRLKKKADSRTAEYRQHIAGVRRKAPPLAVKLVSTPEPAWLQEWVVAKSAADALTRRGFSCAGGVTLAGAPQWQGVGFVNVEQSASAMLLKLGDQLHTSLGTFFTDGGLFSVTDMAARSGQVFPPWFERHRLTGLTTEQLIDQFLAKRPTRPFRAVDADSFAAGEEEAFARMQAWLAERGGASVEELAEQFKAAGKLPSGEEAGSFLAQLRLHEIEKAAWNWLRLQPELPFPQDDAIEWLAVVHDELPVDDLANTYWCYAGDFGVRADVFEDAPPRGAFARVNAGRGNKLQKVFTKETGLPVDFYLPAD